MKAKASTADEHVLKNPLPAILIVLFILGVLKFGRFDVLADGFDLSVCDLSGEPRLSFCMGTSAAYLSTYSADHKILWNLDFYGP